MLEREGGEGKRVNAKKIRDRTERERDVLIMQPGSRTNPTFVSRRIFKAAALSAASPTQTNMP